MPKVTMMNKGDVKAAIGLFFLLLLCLSVMVVW